MGTMKSEQYFIGEMKVLTAASTKFTAYAPLIALIMDVVRTSETSVYFNETIRRYMPGGCNLQNFKQFIVQNTCT
jgi:hypothetical protein